MEERNPGSRERLRYESVVYSEKGLFGETVLK